MRLWIIPKGRPGYNGTAEDWFIDPYATGGGVRQVSCRIMRLLVMVTEKLHMIQI